MHCLFIHNPLFVKLLFRSNSFLSGPFGLECWLLFRFWNACWNKLCSCDVVLKCVACCERRSGYCWYVCQGHLSNSYFRQMYLIIHKFVQYFRKAMPLFLSFVNLAEFSGHCKNVIFNSQESQNACFVSDAWHQGYVHAKQSEWVCHFTKGKKANSDGFLWMAFPLLCCWSMMADG